jgi:hypothetical protein
MNGETRGPVCYITPPHGMEARITGDSFINFKRGCFQGKAYSAITLNRYALYTGSA